MKRLVLFTRVVGALLLILPTYVFSQSSEPDILIVELQTGSSTSAGEEFIELYNPTDRNIDVSQYKIEYYSASSDFTTPSRSIPLHGILYASKHYLLASTGYLADKANDSFSSGFSKTGGHLQLISPDSNDNSKVVVRDLVGWGTALQPEGTAAAAPPDGHSLLRKIDSDGNFIDTDDNSADFAINILPAPIADNLAPENISAQPNSSNSVADSTNPPENESIVPPAANLLPLSITELLPNPAPPDSDSTDEFVELYNPNSEPIDLNGYKLQTGSSYSYSYVFADGTIDANSYEALMVSETGVLLANSGGKARLIDPSGKIISETAPYEDAAEGQAWALLSGNWAWTTTPTPNEANILTVPLAKESAVSSTKAKTTKKTSAKVKTASTKKSASTAKKTSKTSAVGAASSSNGQDAAAEPASLHPAVLAGVSALAVGYAAYEYRHDMANRLYQFRRYRATRREAREASKGA